MSSGEPAHVPRGKGTRHKERNDDPDRKKDRAGRGVLMGESMYKGGVIPDQEKRRRKKNGILLNKKRTCR